MTAKRLPRPHRVPRCLCTLAIISVALVSFVTCGQALTTMHVPQTRFEHHKQWSLAVCWPPWHASYTT